MTFHCHLPPAKHKVREVATTIKKVAPCDDGAQWHNLGEVPAVNNAIKRMINAPPPFHKVGDIKYYQDQRQNQYCQNK